jgi:Ca-activated chloride channel family protein
MLRRGLLALLLLASSFGTWAQGVLPPPEKKPEPLTRILFVFDASNSMYSRWQTGTRMEVAQRLMRELLDSLGRVEQPNFELALRVYGHQKPVPPQDCNDTRLEVAFSTNSIPRIQKTIAGLRPMGTTPIANSILKAGGDFPDCADCREIIILITDGVEACDGDPCEASRILQSKGIVLKPFVIGIGLDANLAADLGCIGTYYDAGDERTFGKALNVIMAQALDNTSAQINLQDHRGVPAETNVPIVLHNATSGMTAEAMVHTMNYAGHPDTLNLDPLVTYRGTVYTVPPVAIAPSAVHAGKHNHLGTNAAQGALRLNMFGVANRQSMPLAVVRKPGSTEIVHVQPLGSEQRYLVGTYELDILTLPRYRKTVAVEGGKVTELSIPAPGNASLTLKIASIGALFLRENEDWTYVVPLDDNQTRQSFALQPGTYTVIYRPKSAQQTAYSKSQTFTVTSGATAIVNLQ